MSGSSVFAVWKDGERDSLGDGETYRVTLMREVVIKVEVNAKTDGSYIVVSTDFKYKPPEWGKRSLNGIMDTYLDPGELNICLAAVDQEKRKKGDEE